uniref:HMG box domain-containing protein n=1 Tax=Strigamia maritima TaxID=126957 RepID=T1J991_STRMM
MSDKNRKGPKKAKVIEFVSTPQVVKCRSCSHGQASTSGIHRNMPSTSSEKSRGSGGIHREHRTGGIHREHRAGGIHREHRSGGIHREHRSACSSHRTGSFHRDFRAACSSRDNHSGTESRGTRMSRDSKTQSDNSKSTRDGRTKSIDSKTTYPNRKSSCTTLGGQSTMRSSTSRSVTPGRVVSIARASRDGNATMPSTKTSTTQTRRRRRKGMFRGAASAYSFFVKSYYNEFKQKNPNEKIPFITLSRRCADKWHSLPNPIKQEFYKMAEYSNNRKILNARKSTHKLYPIFIRRRISGSTRSLASRPMATRSMTARSMTARSMTTRSMSTRSMTNRRPRISKRNAASTVMSCASSQKSAPKRKTRPIPHNKFRRTYSIQSSTTGRHTRYRK